MKLWIIYSRFEAERNKRAIELYFEGCEKRGIDAELKITEDGISFENLPDAAVVRIMAPELSARLERAGVKVYNNSFLSRVANDKAETYKYLSENGIKIPETFLVTDDFTPPYYPIVMKPALGKGGRDVEMINSFKDFEDYKKRVREKILAQKVVSEPGKDLRVYIVGGKIVCAMLRVSESDFRSNFCLGGRAERYFLSAEEKEEIMKIVRLFDIAYCGIDFMFDGGKIIFNEIEDAVGARMVYTYTDIDIIGKFLDFIISDIKA